MPLDAELVVEAELSSATEQMVDAELGNSMDAELGLNIYDAELAVESALRSYCSVFRVQKAFRYHFSPFKREIKARRAKRRSRARSRQRI